MIQRQIFLVVGSGIAGLSYALKVAEQNYPDKKVLVITKTQADETNGFGMPRAALQALPILSTTAMKNISRIR